VSATTAAPLAQAAAPSRVFENEAAAPTPSTYPAVALPATVTTSAEGSTDRRYVPSVTSSGPLGAGTYASARGAAKPAAAPRPSTREHAPPPASATTLPPTNARRRQPSDVAGAPEEGAAAAPRGAPKVATEMGPSVVPEAPVPAIVVTAPPAVTERSRKLPASTTSRVPSGNRAALSAELKRALAPVPSW